MGRKKIDRGAPIESDNKRTAVFRKRKNVIIKKANELAILCGVEVCVIIYGARGEPPTVWPEDSERLNSILARYMNTSVEERRKRTLSLSTTLGKPHNNEQGSDLAGDKQAEKLPKIGFLWDERINGLSSEQLIGLANDLSSKIQNVEHIIDSKRKQNQFLPKLENAVFYGGFNEPQHMMMMTSTTRQSFPYPEFQCHQTPGNNYHPYLVDEPNMMKMLNNGDANTMNMFDNVVILNNNNYANYNNSSINNGVSGDPRPLSFYNPNDQLNGAQQPFRNEYNY